MSKNKNKNKKSSRTLFSEGWVFLPSMKNGHYSIYNDNIQKKIGKYSYDYKIMYYEDEEDCWGLCIEEAGINKNFCKVHDSCVYDDFKDGD